MEASLVETCFCVDASAAIVQQIHLPTQHRLLFQQFFDQARLSAVLPARLIYS